MKEDLEIDVRLRNLDTKVRACGLTKQSPTQHGFEQVAPGPLNGVPQRAVNCTAPRRCAWEYGILSAILAFVTTGLCVGWWRLWWFVCATRLLRAWLIWALARTQEEWQR